MGWPRGLGRTRYFEEKIFKLFGEVKNVLWDIFNAQERPDFVVASKPLEP